MTGIPISRSMPSGQVEHAHATAEGHGGLPAGAATMAWIPVERVFGLAEDSEMDVTER